MTASAVSGPDIAPPPEDTPTEALPRIAGSWHPWRWVVAGIALLLVAQFAHGLITNPGWDWGTFAQYFTAKSVMSALWVTIELTLWAPRSVSRSAPCWPSDACRTIRCCG